MIPAPYTTDVPVLISQNLWILLYIGEFPNKIKLRILRKKIILDYLGGPYVITEILITGR